jgi:hypothetical protein
MSGTLNPLAATAPAQPQPAPNPLATGTLPAAAPQKGAPAVGDVMAQLGQMQPSPQDIVKGLDRVNYAVTELGKLAGDKSVTRKDVVRATADAVGARKIGAEEGIKFISDMPEKPEQVRPWLQQKYHAALVGAVALHATAHRMAGNVPQPPMAPNPALVRHLQGAGGGGAAMPGAMPQGPVVAPGGGGMGLPGGTA